MSTGIILGFGLAAIVLAFYIVLNFPLWAIEYNKRKNEKMQKPRKYHDWVYEADDSINNVLKTVIYFTYAYGAYVVFAELWTKFV